MNKTILLFPFFAMLISCGGLTESEAKTKMKTEVEEQSLIACDCIQGTASLEGDAVIEETARCTGDGQSALMQLAHDEGIETEFPDIYEEAMDSYFEKVEQCN